MSAMYYLTYLPTMNQSAAAAAQLSNNSMPILALDKEKIANASTPQLPSKIDTSNHFHIFVGDLAPELDADSLRAAFAPFGEISECKIIRDPQTMKSKGYGFVTFVNKKDAENAIASMNGQWLGSRAIRTNWATRKPPQPIAPEARPAFDEVFSQSSSTNMTVYCGGVMQGLTEDLVKDIFGKYGTILEIRVFKEKGYCFVRYENKESATQAILNVNGTEVAGQIVKCSWGKESNENPSVQTAASPLGMIPGQGVQYVLPNSAATTAYYYQAAAANQINQSLIASQTPSLMQQQPGAAAAAQAVQLQTAAALQSLAGTPAAPSAPGAAAGYQSLAALQQQAGLPSAANWATAAGLNGSAGGGAAAAALSNPLTQNTAAMLPPGYQLAASINQQL